MSSKEGPGRARIALNSDCINLPSPEDEPLSIECAGPSSATPSSLLSTTSPLSSWINENGTEEAEFGSTLDVNAIKRSPSNVLGDERGSSHSRKNAKLPLVTIPENWDSIDVSSSKSLVSSKHNPDNSDSEDDSEDSVSSCSHSGSESGSECSGSSSTCSSDEDSSSSSYCSDQQCSTKQKSKSPRRHKPTAISKSGRTSKTESTTTHKEHSTITSIVPTNPLGLLSTNFLIDSSSRGPSKNNIMSTSNDDVNMQTSSHQVTSPVENFLSKNCDSASVLSQAESLFNALTSSSFSKPFPPSKGAVTSRFKGSEVNNRTEQSAKLSSSLSTRKFFKSEKKVDSSRVGVGSSFRHNLHSHSSHFQTSITGSSSSTNHVESLCDKEEVTPVSNTAPMSHLDDQLDHFVKEGSTAAETLHAIAGGLQVIEDADLVAILKDVSSEADQGTFAHDEDENTSSSDADFTSRGTSMQTTGQSDTVSEAISRMALQVDDHRSRWTSTNNSGLGSASNLYRTAYSSIAPFAAKTTTSIATTATSCDTRGIKYSDNCLLATSASTTASYSRARHYSGKKRKSRTSVKSRLISQGLTSGNPPNNPSSSPYSQPPTLQPHFVHQGVSQHSLQLIQPKAPPQLVHHQLQQQQDLDLYLNSAASNVSPDSGIQSEGGVNNSSPLHLGDIQLPATSTSAAVSTILTNSNLQNYVQTPQQHILYHSPQLSQPTYSTGTQSWNQSNYYGSYVSPSYSNNGQLHNQSYVYPSGQTPVTATLVVTTETQAPTSQYFSQKSPIFRMTRQKSPTTSQHSSSSGGDRKVKRGRGRPKGSKNKVPKKTTMDCGSQTVESSLETGTNTNNTNNHSRSSSSSSTHSSMSESDSSSVGSLPPPLPLFMGPSTTVTSDSSSRSRPRKDPPRLVPEVIPSLPPPPPPPLKPSSMSPKTKLTKHKEQKLISLSPRIRTLSTLPLKTSCEVIMLDSDDSTVFSDNNGEDSEYSDDDEELDKIKMEKSEEPPRPNQVSVQTQNSSNKIERLPVLTTRSTSPSASEQEQCDSPEPPVLIAAAVSTRPDTPPCPIVSKPKKHHRSDEERSRKKSKHKSKKKQSKKEKKRHRKRSVSPPKIDRESSVSPIHIKSSKPSKTSRRVSVSPVRATSSKPLKGSQEMSVSPVRINSVKPSKNSRESSSSPIRVKTTKPPKASRESSLSPIRVRSSKPLKATLVASISPIEVKSPKPLKASRESSLSPIGMKALNPPKVIPNSSPNLFRIKAQKLPNASRESSQIQANSKPSEASPIRGNSKPSEASLIRHKSKSAQKVNTPCVSPLIIKTSHDERVTSPARLKSKPSSVSPIIIRSKPGKVDGEPATMIIKSKPSSTTLEIKSKSTMETEQSSIPVVNSKTVKPYATEDILAPSQRMVGPPSMHHTTTEEQFENLKQPTKITSFSKGKLVPVFDAKYCSLKPDEFWKMSSASSGNSQKSTIIKAVIENKKSVVSTKAAIKEVAPVIPPVAVSGSAVKTMLQVLAVASKKGKPGRKPKPDRKSSLEWTDLKIGISPGSSCHSSKSPFSPQSVASGGGDSLSAPPIYTHVQESVEGYKKKKDKKKKKKKKTEGAVWRSKHKNVIDPVLLGEVEHLMQDLVNMQISSTMSKDYWPDRPRDSVPSIFRRRKILVGGRCNKTSVSSPDKPAPAKRGRPKKNAANTSESGTTTSSTGTTSTVTATSKNTLSAFDALLASSDPAEQRLPLKKRHHHHIQKDQTGNGNCTWDSESGNSSSGCCATSPPIKPISANQRRASVQSRNEAASLKSSGRNSRIPSVEEVTLTSRARIEEKLEKEKPEKELSKSRIKILEERCETILKENNTKSKTKHQQQQLHHQQQPEPEKLISSNIVESIAACVDKYTGKHVSRKDLSQKLNVKATPAAVTAILPLKTAALPIKAVALPTKTSLTSPRKRHLLELREKEELDSTIRYSSPPPLLPSVATELHHNPSWTESLPPPLLEKVSSLEEDSKKVKLSKKSPLRISIDKFCEHDKELVSVHSPPHLSPPHKSPPQEEPYQPVNLLIQADLLAKKIEKQEPLKKRGRPPAKKLEVVCSNQYLPRCSDISEDEIEDKRPPASVKKEVCDPDKETKRNIKRKFVDNDGANLKETGPHSEPTKSLSKRPKDSPNMKETEPHSEPAKTLTKRQKALAATKVLATACLPVPEKAPVVENVMPVTVIPTVIDSLVVKAPVVEYVALVPTAIMPKLVVPKILKANSSQVVTQNCSVRVEKLTDNFVSKTKKDDKTTLHQSAEKKDTEKAIEKAEQVSPKKGLKSAATSVSVQAKEQTSVATDLPVQAKKLMQIKTALAALPKELTQIKTTLPVLAVFPKEATPVLTGLPKESTPVEKNLPVLALPVLSKELTPAEKTKAVLSQELTPVEKTLAVLPKELTPVEKDLPVLPKELKPVEKSLPVLPEELTPVENDLPVLPKELTTIEKDVPVDAKKITSHEKSLPFSAKELALVITEEPMPAKTNTLIKTKKTVEASLLIAVDTMVLASTPTTSVTNQPEKSVIEKLKKRKRKANRTGFPTAKKKKKITTPTSSTPVETCEPKTPKPVSRPPSSAEQVHPVRSSSRKILVQDPEPKIEEALLPLAVSVKGKRGRPSKISEIAKHSTAAKRSKIYEQADEEVDCLALLPAIESSGPSSETQSSAETDDVIAPEDDLAKKRRKKKHKQTAHQSPFKKNYLVAGLFSDYYKTTTPANGDSSKKVLTYNVNEHVHGLLPPPYYCGRQLRQKKEEFKLPYDLWWLHAHNQLPGRDVVATWNYKRVKNNVFFDIKPLANFEAQSCHCKHKDGLPGCGEDCINRMTYSECDPRLCPLGDRCTNNQIQKHRGVSGLERFMTEEKGWGVRVKSQVQSGEFVMEYVGEVVSEKEFKLRMLTEYVDDTHHYCLHLDGGAVIDGHRMGGECRFVNHSCRPNCEMQKWTVNGLYRMALFTQRDIEVGEELTYDYNFSLFNPHEGQVCRCGAADCRGVIGGRTQRVNGLSSGKVESKSDAKQNQITSLRENAPTAENRGRDRKKVLTVRRSEGSTPTRALQLLAQVKPMSHQQRCFAQEHRCFLLRNLEKVRRIREKIQRKVAGVGTSGNSGDDSVFPAALRPKQMIMTGLTALATARSMQTRRLAIAQDDPNVTKVVKLAQLLREIYTQVTSLNDENGKMMARYFGSIPSNKKHPMYLALITEPVDLLTIDRNINTGFYASAEQFDNDLLKLFQNNLRYFGHNSSEGQSAIKLRELYNNIKTEYHEAVAEFLGPAAAVCFQKKPESRVANSDDIIDCICGQFKDEGLMIQCEGCHIWQHCDCVGQPKGEENYFCQDCGGPKANLDIHLIPQPEYASPGETYHVSLLREALQVKLGDTVYVLRAFKTPKEPESQTDTTTKKSASEEDATNLSSESSSVTKDDESGLCFTHGGIPHKMMSPSKGPSMEASSLTKGNYPTFRTVDRNVSTDDMDIFRIERLWINEKGERFAFGHHYLRPHETFHEPNRKFFRNEVFRVPLYEVLPLETIWGQCWVLDYAAFCKGRPIGAVEEHVYICEYRVDKTARLFNKISKPKYPVCTKKFAFDHFDHRLKPSRIYTPHEVPDRWKITAPRSRSVSDDRMSAQSDNSHTKRGPIPAVPRPVAGTSGRPTVTKVKQTAAVINQQKSVRTSCRTDKLEVTLQKLLSQMSSKSRIDASYLLEHDKRTRKRPPTKNSLLSKFSE